MGAFIKEERKFLNQLNKVLDDWKGKGRSNDVRMIESELQEFYESIGKNPKQENRFNTRLKLTEEQADELYNIAQQAMESDIYYEEWESKFEGYEELTDEDVTKFESLEGKYGIETFQHFVDFYEKMNRFKTDRVISSVLSSSQYASLARQAEENGMDEEELEERIYFEYSLQGLEQDDLYEFIYKSI